MVKDVKSAVLNLLFFLLVFLIILLFEIGFSALFMFLVPGGQGSFFSRPIAGAVYPALIGGFLVASARLAHSPNAFKLSYVGILVAGFLLVSLSLPLIQNQPTSSLVVMPTAQGVFWKLDGHDQLYLPKKRSPLEQFASNAVLVPANGPMVIIPRLDYDPWNKRFLLPEQGARGWDLNTAEQRLFAYPPALKGLEADFFTVYYTLKQAWTNNPVFFFTETFLFVWLFWGIQVFFIYRTWPLITWILALFAARLFLAFTVFCLVEVPSILHPWLSLSLDQLAWFGLLVLGLAAASLFFFTFSFRKPPKDAS